MSWAGAAVPLLLASAAVLEAGPGDLPGLSAQGILYYDRGHYWIEIAFRDSCGRDTIPPESAPSAFEIARIGGQGEVFKPSRAEATMAGARRSVILHSSRLEGRACYRVRFTAGTGETVVADSICDPFAVSPSSLALRGGRLRRAVAGLFAQCADPWRLNAFSYEYDLSRGRPSMRLALDPRLRLRGWTLEGSLRLGESGALGRQSVSLAAAKGTWSHRMRFAVAALCRLDRLSRDGDVGDSSLAEARGALEGRIRFDDLLDRLGASSAGVMKGIEAAFGYEWCETVREGPEGGARFERVAPYVWARGTWTALAAFQLSYAVESHWPGGLREEFVEFHSLRARLLLRDALESPPGRAYHPDVELAWDAGRRPPLFQLEESVSLGFVFDLYPW